MTQRIGVIGGSGFIGGWLVSLLLTRHHAVRVVDVNPSQDHPELLVRTDVRDREALHQACRGCDVLYNLAAEHRDDVRPVELYHQVNVIGAHNTCGVAEQLGIERLIFTSTAAEWRILRRLHCIKASTKLGRRRWLVLLLPKIHARHKDACEGHALLERKRGLL